MNHDWNALWQEQQIDVKEIDMEQVILRAEKMEKRLRSRDLREIIAAIVVVIAFTVFAVREVDWIRQLLYTEIAIAAAFIAGMFWMNRSRLRSPDISMGTQVYLREHRQQLTIQMQLLRRSKFWYVAPIFVGLLGLSIHDLYAAWTNHESLFGPNLRIAFHLLLFGGIVWLNEKAANSMREEIRGLEDCDP